MSYFVSIDPDTKEYFARLSNSQLSSPTGKGDSLYAAIDDLENKLKAKKSKKSESSPLVHSLPSSRSEEALAIPIPL